MPRSSPVHGVVESFVKSKKYIVPSAVFSPIFAGCVAAVYVGTGTGHFDPARNALVFVAGGVAGGDRERPLDREDRRAYQLELKHFLADAYPENPKPNVDRAWKRLQSRAKTTVDAQGQPVLQLPVEDGLVEVGMAAGNVLNGNAPPELVSQLLEARLQSELRRRSAQDISETEVERDWQLLQKSMAAEKAEQGTRDASLTADSTQHSESTRGNRP